jgi:hypothetical protein
MQIFLENPNTGQHKEAKIGFSWTTFFFGFIPALTRGDWKWGAIQFLVACCTLGLSGLVFMFIYNKLYIKDLLNDGFKPSDEHSRQALQSHGFVIPQMNNMNPA